MLNQRMLKEAMSLHQRGKHLEAKELYEKVQRSAPQDAHVFHFRGLLATHMGDQKSAVDLLEKAVRLNGNVPEFHEALAQAYTRVQRMPGRRRRRTISSATLCSTRAGSRRR